MLQSPPSCVLQSVNDDIVGTSGRLADVLSWTLFAGAMDKAG